MNWEALYRQMVAYLEQQIRFNLHMVREYDHSWEISRNASYLESRNKYYQQLRALRDVYMAVGFQMPKEVRGKVVSLELLQEMVDLTPATIT